MNFEKGDSVYSPKYGEGVVLDTDPKTKYKEFSILCRFNDRGHTLVWLGEDMIVKK